MQARNKRKTIRDVAKHANVSVGTVSRVLNGHANVQLEIKKRVQQSIEKLGFLPNAVAQSMRTRFTFSIGCVFREVNVPQLNGFVRSAHDILDEAGFSLLITNSEGRPDRERAIIERLAQRRTDGIIIQPYTPLTMPFKTFLTSLRIPIIIIDREPVNWADGVMIDHVSGMRAAVGALIERGHRRIALLTGQTDLYPARERIRGYEAAFAQAGLPIDRSLILTSSFVSSTGFRLTSVLLGQPNPPTAIVAGGVDMLSGILRAIRGRGLRIPQDVSVIASTDSELAELHTPPIAVIDWSQSEIGSIAAGMLLERLRSGKISGGRHVLIPSEYISRMSVGPPR